MVNPLWIVWLIRGRTQCVNLFPKAFGVSIISQCGTIRYNFCVFTHLARNESVWTWKLPSFQFRGILDVLMITSSSPITWTLRGIYMIRWFKRDLGSYVWYLGSPYQLSTKALNFLAYCRRPLKYFIVTLYIGLKITFLVSMALPTWPWSWVSASESFCNSFQ